MAGGLKGNKTHQRFTSLTWSNFHRRSPQTSRQGVCQLSPPRVPAPIEPDIPVKLQVTRVNYPCPRSRASSLAAAPSIDVSHELLSVFNLVLMLAHNRGARLSVVQTKSGCKCALLGFGTAALPPTILTRHQLLWYVLADTKVS